jgi:hypothetical protein
LEKKIIGKNELIELPEYGVEAVKAKVDTGARTSAIHASNIKLKRINGKNVISFYLLGNHKQKLEFEEFTSRHVKSSNGHSELRFSIKLLVKFYGKKYRTEFTLTKRSEMNFPVLLGRRFLRNRFIVDVSKMYVSSTITT